MEYAYGYNFDDTTGVCRSIPGYHAKFVLKERLFLGETLKTKKEIEAVIEEISEEFLGKDYHLLLKNCNHFSDFLAKNLVGKGIPSRVNRISQVGHCLSCILPPSIWKSALLEEVPIKPQTCQWYS